MALNNTDPSIKLCDLILGVFFMSWLRTCDGVGALIQIYPSSCDMQTDALIPNSFPGTGFELVNCPFQRVCVCVCESWWTLHTVVDMLTYSEADWKGKRSSITFYLLPSLLYKQQSNQLTVLCSLNALHDGKINSQHKDIHKDRYLTVCDRKKQIMCWHLSKQHKRTVTSISHQFHELDTVARWQRHLGDLLRALALQPSL